MNYNLEEIKFRLNQSDCEWIMVDQHKEYDDVWVFRFPEHSLVYDKGSGALIASYEQYITETKNMKTSSYLKYRYTKKGRLED